MSYFDIVNPTYLENWPSGLCQLSVAQVDIPLTVPQASALGSHMMDFGEAFEGHAPIDDIRKSVSDAVGTFPAGAFVRLGSRSPKDAWSFSNGAKIRPGEDPLRLLLDASERIYEDLKLAIQNDYAPHIFVRQWLDFEPWQEFRCFQRGRRLVGVSQYNYIGKPVFPQIAKHESTIWWAIDCFHARFRELSHLDDVIFDVIAFIRTNKNTRYAAEVSAEIKLLEINPFFEMTDPCLFDWRERGASLDGRFLYCK